MPDGELVDCESAARLAVLDQAGSLHSKAWLMRDTAEALVKSFERDAEIQAVGAIGAYRKGVGRLRGMTPQVVVRRWSHVVPVDQVNPRSFAVIGDDQRRLDRRCLNWAARP